MTESWFLVSRNLQRNTPPVFGEKTRKLSRIPLHLVRQKLIPVTTKNRAEARFFVTFKLFEKSVLGLVDNFIGRNPGHHAAKLFTDDFNFVGRVVATMSRH